MTQHLMAATMSKAGAIDLITYRALPYPLPDWAQLELQRRVGDGAAKRDSLEDSLREAIGVEVTRRFIHPLRNS